MEKVFILRQNRYDSEETRILAREIITASGINPSGKSVLLKPSFVYPSHSPLTVGVVTQPAFIRGVALALWDLGASCVMVGEDSVIGPARAAFYAMGVYPYLRDVAMPIYFDEIAHKLVRIQDAIVQRDFIVPAVWLDADLFVSLPKIKVNQFAKVTLSVKNNLGFLRQRQRVINHSDGTLHEKIADLYRVRPPDLVIADSIVAGEGQGPMLAKPVELGVVVGGSNGVAVDATASRLMGFNPAEIEHLTYLNEEGIGPISEGEIEIVGEKLKEVSRPFTRPTTTLGGISENLRVIEGQEKCCSNGCKGMIRCALDAWIEREGRPLRQMNVIVGKGIDEIPGDLNPGRTLVVGDCASVHRGRGTFVEGCPPLPMDVAFAIQKFQGFVPTPLKIRDLAKGYVAGYGWKAARFFRGYENSLCKGE